MKGTIHARLARDGETIEALDGKTYTLDSEMTVIADDTGPEGIAGIIGGAATGCRPETTNVFLEAAYFDPIRTAATGRKLGINSDARYRFERGVDPAFVEPGAEIATRMILDLCGGEASELVIAGRAPLRSLSVPFRLDRVKTLAGVDIPPSEQLDILRGARLRRCRRRQRGGGRGAVLAARHQRRGRSRRGGRPRLRPRPGRACGPAAA